MIVGQHFADAVLVATDFDEVPFLGFATQLSLNVKAYLKVTTQSHGKKAVCLVCHLADAKCIGSAVKLNKLSNCFTWLTV